MLHIIIGLIIVLVGAVVCGYGIATTKTGKRDSDKGSSDTDFERRQQELANIEQRANEAIARSSEAGKNIQDIIADIRKHPINNDSDNGGK